MSDKKCKVSKKVRDFENASLSWHRRMPPNAGINNTYLEEPVPEYEQAGCENVYPSNPSPTNAWIVVGRDRPHVKASGEGGEGHTQCGAIDLVCGRMSYSPKSEILVNSRFSGPDADAARIYITQKSKNIDEYLDLAGPHLAKKKSAIAMKADAIRIVARQGIKLVTLPPYDREELSTGCELKTQYGISLIAGNVDGTYAPPGKPFAPAEDRIEFIQPIPLGDNLVRCLKRLTDELDDLGTRVHRFITAQMEYNRAISTHYHEVIPTPAGLIATPQVNLMTVGVETDIKQFVKCISTDWTRNINLSTFKTNHLKKHGCYWICSRMNRTT